MDKKKNIFISLPATGEQEWHAVRESIISGWLTQGPKVAEFESAFAVRHGVKYAVATTSCTAALHLILAAMDIGPGDEVIIPSFTWIATANVVLYCGAKPVFVDVDKKTFNMDASEIAQKVNKNTKAVIAVHLFGLCADIDTISAAAPGIPIIEDAACATGCAYKNRPAGSLGVAAAFSFHPRKSITTGEGGMVTTNKEALAKKISVLRNHGASVSEEDRHHHPIPYILPEFNLLGYNYRMTDVQGAIGLVQLSKLDLFIEERRELADFYTRELADIKWLRTPVVPEGYSHGWQAYVCFVEEGKAPMPRNEMMAYLHWKGISTRPGTHAVHMLDIYKERFGFNEDAYPNARDCDRCTMAIPLHNRMSIEDHEYVVETIKEL